MKQMNNTGVLFTFNHSPLTFCWVPWAEKPYSQKKEPYRYFLILALFCGVQSPVCVHVTTEQVSVNIFCWLYTTLWVHETIQRRMTGCFMDNVLERIRSSSDRGTVPTFSERDWRKPRRTADDLPVRIQYFCERRRRLCIKSCCINL
jgi:hypothetical protein